MAEQLDRLVAEIEENTDRNFHTENLVVIVNRFDCLERYREDARKVQEDHEKQGWMTVSQRNYRDDLIRTCVEVIRRQYGDAFADKINGVL